MSDEILYRVQNIEYQNSKIKDFLTSSSSNNSLNYILENRLVLNQINYLQEANEALNSKL